MKQLNKNRILNHLLNSIGLITSVVIIATFMLLYGFEEPVLTVQWLHSVQVVCFIVLIIEKACRFYSSSSKIDYLKTNWYEILSILLLLVVFYGAHVYQNVENPTEVMTVALSVYLVFQVIAKACRAVVELAATGKNPMRALFGMFIVLILAGAGLLMLPRSHTSQDMTFTDALFTATSATCVTGLVVRDTGTDFTILGQTIILILIQLGGLGIVIFGAVMALLLGQALSVKESVAMQDLLSTQTLGKIGKMIGFIFICTLVIESIGAFLLHSMWQKMPNDSQGIAHPVFCSIFHSISAFCNAGFSLFRNNLMDYGEHVAIYYTVVPLIILGGLGFGVLFNIFEYTYDRSRRMFRRSYVPGSLFESHSPITLKLQTKIVCMTSLTLIILGTIFILFFENHRVHLPRTAYTSSLQSPIDSIQGAFFQSVTARTAGFNTIDIASLTSASKFILIVLMFIGGSPGSTAGGIKTVTLAVIVMVAVASMRKRSEVELFKRSVRAVVVGRAITVTLIFILVFVLVALALSYTERNHPFSMEDIMFETGSALGTVGLSTGITPALTNAGKLIIIATMLIGRLGPLTLLALLTFNLKPAGYSYPDEPIIVG